jgi:hypothetical protein
MVQDDPMTKQPNTVRPSISLPARRVRTMAQKRRTSSNKVLVELIETGLAAKANEKQRFFALAGRLAESQDAGERRRINEELARITFGE